MKKNLFLIAVIVVLTAHISVYGQAKSSSGQSGKGFAFIFNLGDQIFAVNDYNDGGGGIGGLGIKYWLLNNLALRALLMLNLQTQADTFSSRLGIGAGAELHLVQSDVSPYLGGLAGIFTEPVPQGTALNFYLGAIVGAEAKLWNYLSAYAEYSLMMTFREDSFDMNLGMGNGGQIGLLFYIK